MNIVCKVYERVKKLQNENKKANISSMQTAGKKNGSNIDNLIMMNAIIEKQRQDHKNTYILFSDAEKRFGKLRLKEMERIGYLKSEIKILYKMSKTTEIAVDTAIGNTESIEITEVVKQGSIFGPTMCFATTAKVNENTSEQVKAGNIQGTKKYKYLGITINEEGNLKGCIGELKQMSEGISKEIEIIGSRNQVGNEEIRVQLKLFFEPCFMPALIYGIEAWGCIKKEEMKKIERIQGKALKRIFKLPLSTAYTGVLMKQKYGLQDRDATLMLCHNIKRKNKRFIKNYKR